MERVQDAWGGVLIQQKCLSDQAVTRVDQQYLQAIGAVSELQIRVPDPVWVEGPDLAGWDVGVPPVLQIEDSADPVHKVLLSEPGAGVHQRGDSSWTPQTPPEPPDEPCHLLGVDVQEI